MITRCYGDHSGTNKCYKEVTVCDEWMNYQAFADWYDKNYPKDGVKYVLDKDLKSKKNKIYSPETCVFLTVSKNTELSCAKNWVFSNPAGDNVKIYNLSQFCKDNNLLDSKMNLVYTGKRNHHKGWTKPLALSTTGSD